MLLDYFITKQQCKQVFQNKKKTWEKSKTNGFKFHSKKFFLYAGAAAEKERNQPTDDDLLYDPEEDDENSRWVEKQRRSYQPQTGTSAVGSKKGKVRPLPSSDAVLDCPACMTTLCLDCQRYANLVQCSCWQLKNSFSFR